MQVSTIASKPANCASVGNAAGTPGDYIKISTTLPFTPIFPGTVASTFLPASLTASTLMRLI